MKNLIVFVALFAACYAGFSDMLKDPQKKENAEQCAKETGADLNEMMKSKERMHELMGQKEYKCFMKCFSIKNGFFNEKGEINMDKVQEIKKKFTSLDPAKIIEVATKCSAENRQSDLCEKVSQTNKCIFMALKPQ